MQISCNIFPVGDRVATSRVNSASMSLYLYKLVCRYFSREKRESIIFFAESQSITDDSPKRILESGIGCFKHGLGTAVSILEIVGAWIKDEFAAGSKLGPSSNVSADVAMAVAIELSHSPNISVGGGS